MSFAFFVFTHMNIVARKQKLVKTNEGKNLILPTVKTEN
jgi:hypothetical protein